MKKGFRFLAFIMSAFMLFSFCACSSKSSSGDSRFSGNTTGSVMELMYDVIGKDQATAEKMIGEFFGVELNDRTGNIMTNTRNGIVTQIHVYNDMLAKDSVRFTGMEIWTDEKDGRVRRIELSFRNDGAASASVEDTPELQSEIKKLYNDIDAELKKSLGRPKESGTNSWDEDSFWAYYEISSDHYVYEEVIDYTEPGGNGLVATIVSFADTEVLLE